MYGPVQNYLRLHASVHISTQADRQFVHEARAKNVQRRLSLLDKALRPCSFGACVAGIIVTEKRRRLSQLQTCYTYVNFGKGRTAVRTCALHQSSDGNILYIWLSFTWCFFCEGCRALASPRSLRQITNSEICQCAGFPNTNRGRLSSKDISTKVGH